MVATPTIVRKVLVLIALDIKGQPHLLQYQSPEWGSMPLIPNVNHDGELDVPAVQEAIAQRLGVLPAAVLVLADQQRHLDLEKVSASSGVVKRYEYILVPAILHRIPNWLREIREPDRSLPSRANDNVYYSWWPLNDLKTDTRVANRNALEIDFLSKSFGSNMLTGLPRSRFDLAPELIDGEYVGAGELLVLEVERFLESNLINELKEENEILTKELGELRDTNAKLNEALKATESQVKHANVRARAWEVATKIATIITILQGLATLAVVPGDVESQRVEVNVEINQVTQSFQNFEFLCERIGLGELDYEAFPTDPPDLGKKSLEE